MSSMSRRIVRGKSHQPHPPVQATIAGYGSLVFSDDFDSISTLDIDHSGDTSHSWYLDRLKGWKAASASDFTIADSVLTINQSDESVNCGIATISSVSGNGKAFGPSYFEARMRFNTIRPVNTQGWPSFWSLSTEFFMTRNQENASLRWAELDFFEEVTAAYNGSLHDWNHLDTSRPKIDYCNIHTNYASLAHVDKTQWHSYGCLWEPGRIRYYFDNLLILTTHYSTTATPPEHPEYPVGTFSILDNEPRGMTMIIGSGLGWPLEVDWVRVWGAKDSVKDYNRYSPSPRLPWTANFDIDTNHIEGGGGARVSRVTTDTYSGSGMLQVVHSADTNSDAGCEILGCIPGAFISLHAIVRGRNGATPIRITLHYFDSSNNYISNHSNQLSPDGSWQNLAVNGVIPATAAHITLSINKPGFSTALDTVFVDELTVR